MIGASVCGVIALGVICVYLFTKDCLAARLLRLHKGIRVSDDLDNRFSDLGELTEHFVATCAYLTITLMSLGKCMFLFHSEMKGDPMQLWIFVIILVGGYAALGTYVLRNRRSFRSSNMIYMHENMPKEFHLDKQLRGIMY